MKDLIEEILNDLIKCEINKKEAINKLLYLNSINSSICKGDLVRVDNEDYAKVIRIVNKEVAIIKYDDGTTLYDVKKWRLKKYM